MARRRVIRWVGFGLLAFILSLFASVWIVGDVLIRPMPSVVGTPPKELAAKTVLFRSASGSLIHGWFAQGTGRGAVLLLHGVRANRLSMIDRAELLNAAGYAVLLIDFQASGESAGQAITFGYLESRDAAAAVVALRRLAPDQPIGVVGTSMGGAAFLLADPRLKVDAVVLEQVYPTLAQALDDRLRLHAGRIGEWLAPLLAASVKPHLGISLDEMRPIDRIAAVAVPKLLIAGGADEHTPLEESMAMYRAAAEPKELWVVAGARHVDLERYAGEAYRRRLLLFFNTWLRHDS